MKNKFSSTQILQKNSFKYFWLYKFNFNNLKCLNLNIDAEILFQLLNASDFLLILFYLSNLNYLFASHSFFFLKMFTKFIDFIDLFYLKYLKLIKLEKINLIHQKITFT